MKILLINPPPRKPNPRECVLVPPLGIAYLASVLEHNRYHVDILDGFALQMSWTDFEKYVKNAHVDIIGVTSMTPTRDRTIKAIEISRKYCDYIILGGPHVSSNLSECISNKSVDFVTIGESEETIIELLKAIENNKDFSSIRGIAYKINENIIVNPQRSRIEGLDAIPFPAYHLLPIHKYKYPLLKHKKIATLITSRGCPYNCIFCDKNTSGFKWRARSASNVVSEIEYLYNKFGIKSFIFYDDIFTLNKKRVEEICELIIDKKLDIDWKCEGRVNLVDKDILGWMKKAGCSVIAYGVESGVQKNLDYIRKKISLSQALNAFNITRQEGIRTIAYFIFGIPGETYEDAIQTINFSIKLNPDYAQFALLRPWPGTDIYAIANQNGWLKEIDAVDPFGQDLKRLIALSGSMSESELKNILKVAYFKFNFRPKYMLKRLLKIRSKYELKGHLDAGLKYMKWVIGNISKSSEEL